MTTFFEDSFRIFHCFYPLVSNSLTNGLISMFAECTTLLRVCKEQPQHYRISFFDTTWTMLCCEGTPVLWICKIQGAQRMICLKKTKIVVQDQKLGAMGSANPNPNPNPSPKIFTYCNLEIAWNESLSKCTCKLMWMNSHTCKWPPLIGVY